MSTVPPELPRVLHFVTGGFSGATQVAVDLVRAHGESGLFDSLLVLRRKRQTDPARIAALRAQGLAVEVVPGWSHAATIWQLVRLCRKFRPDLLVAHGFSEHLWGRYAGLIARVPRLVQVEHNSRERYTRWRQAQMLWLARRTQAIVGVSQGVREALLARGVDPSKTLAIPNGIRLEPYAQAHEHPYASREPGIVMAARFARQKDHASLLHALALLRQRGQTPALLLAGGGKASAIRQA
ncbi:MAG: glycosyltransferase, partial [Giesbergeria sp.]